MVQKIIIIILFVSFFGFLIFIGIRNKINKTESTGKPPINKYLFLLAKVSIFLSWLLAIISAYKPLLISNHFNNNMAWIGTFLILAGILFVIFGYISLGKYTKFGLATGESELITSGIYKYSRNPMYIGLYLMVAGSIMYCPNWIVITSGVLTIILHHKIVLAEENSLETMFGKEWVEYKKISKRYI